MEGIKDLLSLKTTTLSMENQQAQNDKSLNKKAIIKEYRKTQTNLMYDLRSNGPSVNRYSLLMVLVQVISVVGILSSVVCIIYSILPSLSNGCPYCNGLKKEVRK